jgi:hypothetical protein
MTRPALPTHTSYYLDEEIQHLLPPFVLANIQHILECHRDEKSEDGEETRDEQILYAQLTGCIDRSFQDVSRHILLWIGSHDNTLNHIYVGGSSCWIQPNNHYLSFRAIGEELLPPMAERDPFTWWIVREPEYGEAPYLRVYRIHIAPEDQVPDGFPDL